MDKATLGGVLLAVGGILAGLLLEGGNLGQILQPTAAMIVFGGTIGAVLIQFPLPVALSAFRRLAHIFLEPKRDPATLIAEMVKYANKARREGIVSLDSELAKIEEPFLKKSLMLAVDGTEPQELRKMMELELDNKQEHEATIPQVFESAGGFSPTIGIIGAVLGPDPGHAASGQDRRSGSWDRGRVRGHNLWRGRGQPVFSSRRRQTENSHPRGPCDSRNDPGGSDFHSRGHEPAHA